MKKKALLAVLGRGHMMEYPGGPFKPTRDFDIWVLGGDPKTARPTLLAEKNDDDPNSVIGGGELNLAAGIVLYKERNPDMTVFAYGDNSPALAAQGFPSESSVVTQLFVDEILKQTNKAPSFEVFDPIFWDSKGERSGTFKEIGNIFRLANHGQYEEIVIVTILVHMNRALGMVAKHLQDPEFAGLRDKVRFEVTESVLLRTEPETYARRIWEIFGSQSMIRNLQRETNGLSALKKGTTQTNQPGVVLAETK